MLDPITVLATKTPETTTSSLAAVSAVRSDAIQQLMPDRPSDVLFGLPGIWVQERADDPGTAVSIRGMQDFGRVAITIDGARQNFQRTGHNADGVFYLDPAFISGADVVRGPIANIYGSGAIGGVVSFQTKDVDDILRPGQRWGAELNGEIGSNKIQGYGSAFAAARINPNAEMMVGFVDRSKQNYKDADGNEVSNSGFRDWSGMAKLTLRPADGHKVKFGYIHYNTDYITGQPNPPTNTSTILETGVQNDIANLRWTYNRPDDRLFDFDGNIYWTRTGTDQLKLSGTGSILAGFVGETRNFTINTFGGDANNTTRFQTGFISHALTYGIDGFQDKVDTSGFGTIFTPNGERTVSGGFVQLKSDIAKTFEVISAARYDQYELSGGGVTTDGNRVSPKFTLGLTRFPNVVPYVTYAEGYRAPSVTETLVAGVHPTNLANFAFLPNPALLPEVGKTKEVGLNLRFDDIFRRGDAFRGKINIYQNDVENYIEQTYLSTGQTGQGGYTCTQVNTGPGGFPDCVQYQNIAAAKLQGYEVETNYDAGVWFGGVNFSHVRGNNQTTGVALSRIPPDSVTTTLGTRLMDNRLTVAVRWQAVAAKTRSEIPPATGNPAFPPTNSYNLVNLYVGYQATRDVLASFSIENLLNEEYSRYLTSYPNPTSSQAAPIGFPQPGITFKAGLKVKFGDDFMKTMTKG